MCAPVSATVGVTASTLATAFSVAQILGISVLLGAVLLAVKGSKSKVVEATAQ
ncbi:hypothetical protein [Methanothermococcus okinawensis]|uniref:Uncharacterized protein n=1 Tax=Methanothermococcus okinawensis (strain DSM 14208 / JCM 11175 / IH1) TaxID=647113 RepID=F8AMM4_METOI|nr:hypothetical protein [Methanothermococcus okinawensis]AEH06065.1 hypothetical protein Metok_0067 [Methanothermococcus okinawensis IH1]